MFRRRRSADDEFQDEAYDESAEDEPFTDVPLTESGPWDAGQPYPARERFDFGSLLVPLGPEHEVHLVMADQQHAVWVTIQHGESEMQVQAFAAPKRGFLWDDLRAGTAREISEAGGKSQEAEGPFGTELLARVPAPPGQPLSGPMLVRFIGVDGPRWFVRGTLFGPAASGGEPAGLLEEIFGDLVVVRGDHPVPPRDILELRLPPDVQKAFEEQAATAAAEENRFQPDLNPFDRGPEFTETR